MNHSVLVDMLGESLATAVVAAQDRLSDDTIMSRCINGLWLIERAGDNVVADLSYEDAIAQLEALA